MNSSLVQCPKCQAWLLEGVFNQPELSPCPACGVPLQIEVFPALFRNQSVGRSGEAILIEGESSCFYHPQKKAVIPCQGCGRFLCALCDCELNGQHFCPSCLEAGKNRGKIKNLENQRTLYDNIALSLAVYPLLIFYFTLVTAPAALFVAIRYWNAPRSMVHRTKTRSVAAIILASLQIAGWGLLFFAIAGHRF
ncbi:MAG TPA: hypothetical protein VMA35_13180 [Candidatus Sulfopaludibacter sp.]|nr:hypothetical protein [Candidatus Sulfopaludibacter sp.]